MAGGRRLAASGMGPGPFTVRVTDTAGHQVTAHGITLSPGVIQPADSWMYGAGTVPATHSPTPRPRVPPSGRPTARLAAAIRALTAAAHRWRHLLPAAGPRPRPTRRHPADITGTRADAPEMASARRGRV